MTAPEFHGFSFPPHCKARTSAVTPPRTSAAPTQSMRRVWCRMSRGDRFVGSAPSGRDDLSMSVATRIVTPPTGRLLEITGQSRRSIRLQSVGHSHVEAPSPGYVVRERATAGSGQSQLFGQIRASGARVEESTYISGPMTELRPKTAPKAPKSLGRSSRSVTWARIWSAET